MISIEEIEEKVRALRDKVNVSRGEKQQIEKRLGTLKAERIAIVSEQTTAKEAVILLETASQGAREFITSKFNDIVSFALQSVFGEDYRFETNLEIKRNAVWADFRVKSSVYEEAADPLVSRGGGVVDIVSLALRVVVLELYQPKIAGPIFLDEPTKQLSKEFSGRAAELLRAISKRTGRQIIIVTHDQTLAKESEVRIEL